MCCRHRAKPLRPGHQARSPHEYWYRLVSSHRTVKVLYVKEDRFPPGSGGRSRPQWGEQPQVQQKEPYHGVCPVSRPHETSPASHNCSSRGSGPPGWAQRCRASPCRIRYAASLSGQWPGQGFVERGGLHLDNAGILPADRHCRGVERVQRHSNHRGHAPACSMPVPSYLACPERPSVQWWAGQARAPVPEQHAQAVLLSQVSATRQPPPGVLRGTGEPAWRATK